MGCCGSSEEDEERGLLDNEHAPLRASMRTDSRRFGSSDHIAAGVNYHKDSAHNSSNLSRSVPPQTPVETGNYEQKVLDNILQTAIKDFIDISQTGEPQGSSYDTSKEKADLYLEKVKSINFKSELSGLELPVGSGTLRSQRDATEDETNATNPHSDKLFAAFSGMTIEDKGSMLVGFSTSLSSSVGL